MQNLTVINASVPRRGNLAISCYMPWHLIAYNDTYLFMNASAKPSDEYLYYLLVAGSEDFRTRLEDTYGKLLDSEKIDSKKIDSVIKRLQKVFKNDDLKVPLKRKWQEEFKLTEKHFFELRDEVCASELPEPIKQLIKDEFNRKILSRPFYNRILNSCSSHYEILKEQARLLEKVENDPSTMEKSLLSSSDLNSKLSEELGELSKELRRQNGIFEQYIDDHKSAKYEKIEKSNLSGNKPILKKILISPDISNSNKSIIMSLVEGHLTPNQSKSLLEAIKDAVKEKSKREKKLKAYKLETELLYSYRSYLYFATDPEFVLSLYEGDSSLVKFLPLKKSILEKSLNEMHRVDLISQMIGKTIDSNCLKDRINSNLREPLSF